MLSGLIGKEEHHAICSKIGGMKGGAQTKISNKGIFSDDWDRSAETKARWEDGRISLEHFAHLKENGHHSRAGCSSREQKKGFHSDDFDKSENSKKIWASYTEEEYKRRCENNRIAQLSLSTDSYKRRQEGSSKGGLKSSNIPMWTDGKTNKRSHNCPGEGWKPGQTRRHKITKVITTYYYKEKQ